MRHPTRKAIDEFNTLLSLHETPHMQDWEIECADPDRVREFLDCYHSQAKTDDERFTLMALILGSYEEYHGLDGPDDGTWAAIKEILVDHIDIHRDHVIYYACSEAGDPEACFPITKKMREVLPLCGEKL